METIQDFEDMLILLDEHKVQYLIIGGLAFIYHAKPRYTKDMDLWIGPWPENIELANQALVEFGSPTLLSQNELEQIVQIGIAPDRIDLILHVPGVSFQTAWEKKICGHYGQTKSNWIDIDSLILAKQSIDNPRHQEDVRVLLEVKRLKKNS
ncbi:MAG: hypothetical protein V2A53_03130 [bacterium]